MTPRVPNHRAPDPIDEIAKLRDDVDELLARTAPSPPAMFVREVVLPLVAVQSGGET